MPRKKALSLSEMDSLMAFPNTVDGIIQYYTFNEQDINIIMQHRGNHNRLGFAIQLCYLRYPGYVLPTSGKPPELLLSFVAEQLKIDPIIWEDYAKRSTTRREHLLELQNFLGLRIFTKDDDKYFKNQLVELATQTDKGIILATNLIAMIRNNSIILPTIEVIERICSAALTSGTGLIYEKLTISLSEAQKQKLDDALVIHEDKISSTLTWLRQPAGANTVKNILNHMKRLQAVNEFGFQDGLEQTIHSNRFAKIAREGGQMTSQHLKDLEGTRRYATLVAILLDTKATLIDEIIDMHDSLLGNIFNTAKKKHLENFKNSSNEINSQLENYLQIGKVLLNAKEQGKDPFTAIESVMPWQDFSQSIKKTEELSQQHNTDYLLNIKNSYSQLRKYTPILLETIEFKGIRQMSDILKGIDVIKDLNKRQANKLPTDAPCGFVRKRWSTLVYNDDETLNRRFYEFCLLSELKNSLRAGDIWIKGSRRYKDFEEYLLPPQQFIEQYNKNNDISLNENCTLFLQDRLKVLEDKLSEVNQLAFQDELPDASITNQKLKISPLKNAVPKEAEALISQVYALLPRLKITELLQEVDGWINFSKHFTHLKNVGTVEDKNLLLTVILADGINLGLRKMSESCSETTYAKLSWIHAWYIRDETYSVALAELVNTQSKHPFAAIWGDGTTSSSDGQWFKTGNVGIGSSYINAKYGRDPGVTFYTHISNQYAPFYTRVINTPVRDATYVLDGLLYHESDLSIKEHYTDTSGFTDHVFGLMHLLGFYFAPRIRDLKDTNLYIIGNVKDYESISCLIGGTINTEQIVSQWENILRLSASIKQGTVRASLILRKLANYPRQNSLALALREFGRIERTLFTLDWLKDTELRRKVQIGLNKGEARNALARAVFFNQLGEVRDRSLENQQYRASGLNILVAAIILWNTVYLELCVNELRSRGVAINDDLLNHLSPLGWEHINLTGDYTWNQVSHIKKGQFRSLNL
ncbi:MAG: Tn3 family transposase [Firmicutes bacterium]|nr:Tn3 family transposase [Bacillota bacterium]